MGNQDICGRLICFHEIENIGTLETDLDVTGAITEVQLIHPDRFDAQACLCCP